MCGAEGAEAVDACQSTCDGISTPVCAGAHRISPAKSDAAVEPLRIDVKD